MRQVWTAPSDPARTLSREPTDRARLCAGPPTDSFAASASPACAAGHGGAGGPQDSDPRALFSRPVSLGVVQTAYANGASRDFVVAAPPRGLGLPAVALAKTGVKFVHAAAAAFDREYRSRSPAPTPPIATHWP